MAKTMLTPIRSALFATAALVAVLMLPMGAQAKDAAATATAATAPATTARAEFAAPKIKRPRKAASRSSMRQIAAMEASRTPQCVLFWCGRPATPWLVLGVAY